MSTKTISLKQFIYNLSHTDLLQSNNVLQLTIRWPQTDQNILVRLLQCVKRHAFTAMVPLNPAKTSVVQFDKHYRLQKIGRSWGYLVIGVSITTLEGQNFEAVAMNFSKLREPAYTSNRSRFVSDQSKNFHSSDPLELVKTHWRLKTPAQHCSVLLPCEVIMYFQWRNAQPL